MARKKIVKDSPSTELTPVRPPAIEPPHYDGWSNFFTGLGGTNDRTTHTEFDDDLTLIDDDTLALIYAGDGLGGRIIDVVADDMTREWIYLGEPTDPSVKTINDELQRLNAEQKFNEAIKWQRLFGGSVLLIGAMDGQTPDKPLRPKRIKTIEYLKAIDRTSIPISECVFDYNPLSPTFGQILLYKIRSYVGTQLVEMKVHASRVIPFYNDPIPSRLRGTVDSTTYHWGMSSLHRIYETLRDLGAITQSTVNILMEFIIGKFKITHLAEMLAAGQESKVVKRIEIMNRSKSTINAVLLGDDEEYTRDYATLAGLPEVIDRFMLQLSGSTGIPVTRLFGRSPAGLNATGENDLRNYYDLIEASQRNRLLSPVRSLISLICSYKNIATVPEVTFNSLYQLSEEEKSNIAKTDAETEKFKADTENVYVMMGAKDVADVSKEHGWEPPDAEDFEEPEEPLEEKNGEEQK